MGRTRVGFIGAGFIAGRHLGNLLEMPEAEVVAVADSAPGRAAELAARCGAADYTDYAAMLDGQRLDAVFICLPPVAHGEPERTVIERGLPFFVEKPLGVDAATAEEIAELVAGRGLVTAVGYHWRYLDIVEAAQVHLRENPARLALGYWIDGTPPPTWWTRQAESGGQMVEQATHIFDLARLLVGPVRRVVALGERTPRPAYPEADIWESSIASLHFASGAVGSVASTCLLGWPHRIGLHLFCDRLAIELSEFELMVDVGQGRPLRAAEGNPFQREVAEFLAAVRGERNAIRCPYAEALETHRLTQAATRAAATGLAVDLGPGHLPVAAAAGR